VRKFLYTILLLVVVPCYVSAGDIYKDENGVALGGYDATSYFTEGRERKGSKEHSYKWGGATWYFASANGRVSFINNPEKYAPKFGGYCSNGLSDKHKIGANPWNWRIIDGELYLYHSGYGREQWAENVDSLIKEATQTWGDLKDD